MPAHQYATPERKCAQVFPIDVPLRGAGFGASCSPIIFDAKALMPQSLINYFGETPNWAVTSPLPPSNWAN
jgi:hypothetical protein